MARIIGGAMPQPYGAYAPGQGTRMDLLFRGFLERMQGYDQLKQAQEESKRKAALEERKVRVSERGVEMREKAMAKENEPLAVPPEMVQKVAKHFKITPETFSGYDKQVQVAMIGEMIRETGRESQRKYEEGKDAERRAEIRKKEADAKAERERLSTLGKHFGVVNLARERLEEARTRIKDKFKSTVTTGVDMRMREQELRKLDKYFNIVAAADAQLKQEVPLSDLALEEIEAMASNIDAIVEDRFLGGGLSVEAGAGGTSVPSTVDVTPATKKVFSPGWKLKEPKVGDVRKATSGPWAGKMVVYVGNGQWKRY